jgi:hypothetical protein
MLVPIFFKSFFNPSANLKTSHFLFQVYKDHFGFGYSLPMIAHTDGYEAAMQTPQVLPL